MGQTLKYEAFHLGRKVGSLTVTREVSDERTKIKVVSDFTGKLKPIDFFRYETRSTYMDQKLIEAEGFFKSGSDLNSFITLFFSEESYYLETSDLSTELGPDNVLSTDLFYFEEPFQIKSAIFIRSGEQLSIEKLKDEPGSYALSGPVLKIINHYKSGELSTFEWVIDDQIIAFRPIGK